MWHGGYVLSASGEEVNVYDDCRSVDIIYFDFQKAFEKVPHIRLLTTLKAHGVIGNIHKWIEDWLSEQKNKEW